MSVIPHDDFTALYLLDGARLFTYKPASSGIVVRGSGVSVRRDIPRTSLTNGRGGISSAKGWQVSIAFGTRCEKIRVLSRAPDRFLTKEWRRSTRKLCCSTVIQSLYLGPLPFPNMLIHPIVIIPGICVILCC